MKEINVSRVLNLMKEHPQKYVRLIIKGNKGGIYLPNDVKLSVTHAWIAEFVGEQRTYFKEFDASTETDASFTFALGMRKNKELAYISGTDDEDIYCGYVKCKSKFDNCNDDNDCPEDRFVFCIVTTQVYTIFLAVSDKFSKTFTCECCRASTDQPGVEDVFNRVINSIKNGEVNDEQKESL